MILSRETRDDLKLIVYKLQYSYAWSDNERREAMLVLQAVLKETKI